MKPYTGCERYLDVYPRNTCHLLRIDRIVAQVVPLLVRPDLHRAEIVRPAAPVHGGVLAQIVIGVGNVPRSAPLRPRDYPAEQRERAGVEDSPFADALARTRTRTASVGEQLENAHRSGGAFHRVSSVIVIGAVVQPVADVIQRFGLRRRGFGSMAVLGVDSIYLFALVHQFDHVPERDLQRAVDGGKIPQQLVAFGVFAVEKKK